MEEQKFKQLQTLPFYSSQISPMALKHSPQNPDFVSNLIPQRLFLNSQSPIMSSCFSTEEETREPHHQLSIINDKRLRRIISNRESARRSRMRKKKQIEELQSQVDHLQTLNHQLGQKLIHLLDNNHRVLQENVQLKERVNTLHMVLADLFPSLSNNLEDFANQRGEGTNQSTMG